MKTWLSGCFVRRVCKFLIAVLFTLGFIVSAQDANTPSSEASDAATAPPARKFISPFSGVAVVSYSYTNPYNLTNVPPSPIVRSTLNRDPFSGALMNPDAVPPGPTIQLPTWEPLPPPFFDFPPGTIVRPIAQASQNTNAPVSIVIPDLSVVPDLTYFNFPPGATLKRSAPASQTPVSPSLRK